MVIFHCYVEVHQRVLGIFPPKNHAATKWGSTMTPAAQEVKPEKPTINREELEKDMGPDGSVVGPRHLSIRVDTEHMIYLLCIF